MIAVTTMEYDRRPTIEFFLCYLKFITIQEPHNFLLPDEQISSKIKQWCPNSYMLKQFNHDRIALAPFSHEQSSIMSWATPSTQIGDTP